MSSPTPTPTETATATATESATPIPLPTSRTITYDYDGLLRLIGATEDPGNTYAYDTASNRTRICHIGLQNPPPIDTVVLQG